MKIGILRNPMGIGGAELSMLDLAINLKKQGHDVWMHFDAGDTASMKDFNKYGKLNIRYGKETNFIFGNKNIISEAWAINQLKNTDVVFIIHRHLFSKNLSRAILNVPKKFIYAPGKNSHHVYGRAPGINGFGHLIVNYNNIIFNSKYTLERHKSLNYPTKYSSKFKHVHPPIFLDYYLKRQNQINLAASRRRLGFKSGEFNIGMVGRLIPSKRPLEALGIARDFKRKNMPFVLHFIGDGPLGPQVKAKANQLGLSSNVKFWGMLNDPLEHIASLDAVLHLCQHESLSRAIRESMLMKKPIVAFNGAGNLELIRSPEIRNLLFKNEKEIPDILKFLAQNKPARESLGEVSHRDIVLMEKDANKKLGDLIK